MENGIPVVWNRTEDELPPRNEIVLVVNEKNDTVCAALSNDNTWILAYSFKWTDHRGNEHTETVTDEYDFDEIKYWMFRPSN